MCSDTLTVTLQQENQHKPKEENKNSYTNRYELLREMIKTYQKQSRVC